MTTKIDLIVASEIAWLRSLDRFTPGYQQGDLNAGQRAALGDLVEALGEVTPRLLAAVAARWRSFGKQAENWARDVDLNSPSIAMVAEDPARALQAAKAAGWV